MMSDTYVAVEGPVERRGRLLVLRVPLEAGGETLKATVQKSSFVEDGRLVVVLPEWLTRDMRLEEGSAVHVDNRGGRLNIARLQ